MDELPGGTSTWVNITHAGGFNQGNGIAVDSTGDVFVTNFYNNTYDAVEELPSGTTTWQNVPANGFTGRLPGTNGIVVDSSGDLFVANSTAGATNKVDEYIPLPAAPTNLLSTSTTYESTTLSWDSVSGATSYNVYENGGSTPVATGVTGTGTTVSGLTPGTSYSFTVSAVAAGGESSQSSVTNVLTVPSVPTGLASGSTTSTVSTLNWSAVTGASSYNVYKSGTQTATGVTGTSYTVTNLMPGTSYTFTVSAVNASGESSQSSAGTVSTAAIGTVDLSGSTDVLSGASETVTGVVYDVYNAPVSNAIVDFSGTIGTWGASSVTVDSSGAFTVGWTAPTVTTTTSGTVTATVYGTVYGTVSNVTPTTLSMEVAPPPRVTTTTLAGATEGISFTQTISATGGFAPYTWSLPSGSLPAGLTLDGSTGVISGIPMVSGTSTFTAQVEDTDGNTSTQSLSITVNTLQHGGGSSSSSSGTSTTGNNSVEITNSPVVQPGQPGQPFSQTMTAMGGTGSYSWKIVTGTLPSGLSLDEKSGVISGTTKSTKPEVLTVEATDANGLTQSKQVVVDVVPKGAREVVWQTPDLPAENLPAVVHSDAGTPTTYMPIWYVMQVLNSYGVASTWDGHNWRLSQVTQAKENNPQPGEGPMHIYQNGQLVQNVTGMFAKDPNSGKTTTFMPIWYVIQILQKTSVVNTWDGTTWNIGSQGSTGQTP